MASLWTCCGETTSSTTILPLGSSTLSQDFHSGQFAWSNFLHGAGEMVSEYHLVDVFSGFSEDPSAYNNNQLRRRKRRKRVRASSTRYGPGRAAR
jgi:hypothetical protein